MYALLVCAVDVLPSYDLYSITILIYALWIPTYLDANDCTRDPIPNPSDSFNATHTTRLDDRGSKLDDSKVGRKKSLEISIQQQAKGSHNFPSPRYSSYNYISSTMSDEFDLKILCMGAGYVGGPTMAVIAKQCPKVCVCDL